MGQNHLCSVGDLSGLPLSLLLPTRYFSLILAHGPAQDEDSWSTIFLKNEAKLLNLVKLKPPSSLGIMDRQRPRASVSLKGHSRVPPDLEERPLSVPPSLPPSYLSSALIRMQIPPSSPLPPWASTLRKIPKLKLPRGVATPACNVWLERRGCTIARWKFCFLPFLKLVTTAFPSPILMVTCINEKINKAILIHYTDMSTQLRKVANSR